MIVGFQVIFLPRRIVILVATPLLVHFFGLNLFAQEMETERWSVPMKVDRGDVSTDLLLEFSFERIETLFNGYDPNEGSDNEAMDQFVEALVGGDIEGALDLTDVPSGSSRENSRELLEAFSGMLETVPNILQLEKVVHLGSDRLLLWSLPLDSGDRFYRSFRFVRGEDEVLHYEGAVTEPVSSLINYAFQVQQAGGIADPRGPDEFEYDYAFPNTETAPVLLRFNGTEVDVDAFNPLGETNSPAIDFFNNSMSVLANGTANEYAALFSDFSEGRYVTWAAEQGGEAYEAYRSDMLEYGARVVFLLEADPVSLVFYLPTDLSVSGAPLRYAAVYDNPESGLELTNFYVHGLTDTVLQRREYFEEPFLRPLLRASGAIPEQAGPEVTSVTAGETILPDPDEMIEGVVFQDERGDEAMPTDIEDIAQNRDMWPWLLGAMTIVILSAFALSRRNRNDS